MSMQTFYYPTVQSSYGASTMSYQPYMGQQASVPSYQTQPVSTGFYSYQSQQTHSTTGQNPGQHSSIPQHPSSQLKQMQDYESKVLDEFVTAHDQSLEARHARMEQRGVVHQQTLKQQDQMHQAEMAQRVATHAIQQQQEQEKLRALQQTHRVEQWQGEQQLLAQKERNTKNLADLRNHNLQHFQQQELKRQQEFEQLQRTLEAQKRGIFGRKGRKKDGVYC